MATLSIRYDTGYIQHDLEYDTYCFRTFDIKDEMFKAISRTICFSDCDNSLQICEIFCNGKKVKYVGWQPNMLFTYVYEENGEVAWEHAYPHWEH